MAYFPCSIANKIPNQNTANKSLSDKTFKYKIKKKDLGKIILFHFKFLFKKIKSRNFFISESYKLESMKILSDNKAVVFFLPECACTFDL